MGRIIRKTVKIGDKPTPQQVKELEFFSTLSDKNEEPKSEYSPEEIKELIKLAKEKRQNRKKEVVTLRLSSSTVEKAKSFGKGYTGFLSRLIENAMKDKNLVSHSL